MSLRDKLEKVGFAARVVSRTGLLGSLTPRGVARFVRDARGTKPGPHLTLLLHAVNKPDTVALADERRRVTWAGLDREVNRLAHALVSLGVGAGDRVAVMMRNCCEYIITQHAVNRIGGTVVQIGYRLRPQEIAYILGNSSPKACLHHADYAAFVDEARELAGVPAADTLIVTGSRPGSSARGIRYEELLAGRDSDRPPGGGYSDRGGVMVYTSGTTGKPKGATRTVKDTGLEAVADLMVKVGMSATDRHMIVCPLYHSGAYGFYAVMASLGATCVLVEHFDEKIVLDTIERERITSAFMVPTMLARLAAVDEEERRARDLSSLRWIMSGAAPLTTVTARRFMDAFGPILYNFYGATETGFVTLAGPTDHIARPGTVGRLLRSNRIRIVGDDRRDVAPGEIGELFTSNQMLIDGYHENAAATDAAMLDGYFSVGDLARVDRDGYVYLASRKSDMVISGGVNIYPREIEEHLATHPHIVEAAVIGVPDDEWGETLKAYVVPTRRGALTAADIAAHCNEALAGFKRPRYVEFLDALPRNPTGKVLKRELRELHAATRERAGR